MPMPMTITKKLPKWTLQFIFLASLLQGCVTGEKSPPPAPPKKPESYYTLRLGDEVDYTRPLPRLRLIYIDHHHVEPVGLTTYLGFRGWDMDDDHVADMLEVLNPDGSIKAYAFDFDGDGKIDYEKSATVPRSPN